MVVLPFKPNDISCSCKVKNSQTIDLVFIFRVFNRQSLDGGCTFFAFYTLKDVLASSQLAGMLDVHVPRASLTRFASVSIPAPEQHFHPSSMAFGMQQHSI